MNLSALDASDEETLKLLSRGGGAPPSSPVSRGSFDVAEDSEGGLPPLHRRAPRSLAMNANLSSGVLGARSRQQEQRAQSARVTFSNVSQEGVNSAAVHDGSGVFSRTVGFVAALFVRMLRGFERVIVATGKSWPMTLAALAVFLPVLLGTILIIWTLLVSLVAAILALALVLFALVAASSVVILPFALLGLIFVAVTGGLCYAVLIVWNIFLFPDDKEADIFTMRRPLRSDSMTEEDVRDAIHSWKMSLARAVELKSPVSSLSGSLPKIFSPYTEMAFEAINRARRSVAADGNAPYPSRRGNVSKMRNSSNNNND